MPMRVSGMFSGMDTESIISQLVSARSTKITKLKSDKQKLEWKQEAWQNINTKIYSLYSDKLTNMRYESSYAKKKTISSNENIASVIAGENAVKGSQTLQVKSLAQTGYLTGAKIKGAVTANNSTGKITAESKMSELNEKLVGSEINITVGDGETKSISITEDMTVNKFVSALKEAGINASFDEGNQRFFLSGKGMGADNDFTITGSMIDNADGSGQMSALLALGLDSTADSSKYEELFGTASDCVKVAGQDAEIVLNGATFKGATNTFTVNGLTIDVKGTTATGETMTITTTADTDGIYDMVKDFFDEYNDMMKELSKLYNADSASKYDVLSDEEKEGMSDEEITTWNDKIKGSLLRRDSTIGTLISSMNSIMAAGVKMSDGSTMHLSKFGIETLSYFESEENERYAYHIAGNEDDSATKGKDDKLKAMIATDPEAVTQFFTSLSKELYGKLDKLMASTDYSSIYKVYNDKQMKKDYTAYDTKIKEAQTDLDSYEDKWYDKFTAMEVALSKLQSNQSAISGLLGN